MAPSRRRSGTSPKSGLRKQYRQFQLFSLATEIARFIGHLSSPTVPENPCLPPRIMQSTFTRNMGTQTSPAFNQQTQTYDDNLDDDTCFSDHSLLLIPHAGLPLIILLHFRSIHPIILLPYLHPTLSQTTPSCLLQLQKPTSFFIPLNMLRSSQCCLCSLSIQHTHNIKVTTEPAWVTPKWDKPCQTGVDKTRTKSYSLCQQYAVPIKTHLAELPRLPGLGECGNNNQLDVTGCLDKKQDKSLE
ncbi:uncharacterized protein LOC124396937 [Silurus meridionalis]|uniref:uncharacterized protein LOC124396937 n=1 Tax=Silurus meridionalis TaxID=175797 RepID=UPI001EECE0FB|nr:uncharacterized protein LOC124396937 [Silurus meridionalis]